MEYFNLKKKQNNSSGCVLEKVWIKSNLFFQSSIDVILSCRCNISKLFSSINVQMYPVNIEHSKKNKKKIENKFKLPEKMVQLVEKKNNKTSLLK